MNPRAPEHENPRTTRVRQVILASATHLLIRHGASEVTATRIAQETGVARTTIYRHWPDQARLLLDTVDTIVAPHEPTKVSEDLEADLTVTLTNLRTRMTRHPFRQVFAALLDHANRDRTFVVAQQRFINGVLQPMADVLIAAVDRGDLPSSLDTSQACAVLAGPLFHQHVMLRASIDDCLISEAIHQFLAAANESR